MTRRKPVPATLSAASPLLIGGICLDCGLGFLDANDADHHFKSSKHHYRLIDKALARLGLLAECSGRVYWDGGRPWC